MARGGGGPLSLFHAHERPAWGLIGLFVAVNGLVLLNAVLHVWRVGYDADRHLDYIRALAMGRLPLGRDFFDPPLYYILPAAIRAAGAPMAVAAKSAQLINVACSVAVTYGLLRLCDLTRAGDLLLKTVALGLLGMLPVYYKTFAFVRPEPLLAALTVLATYQVARLALGGSAGPGPLTLLGLVLGLMLLTRQQGLFLALGATAFLAGALRRRSGTRAAVVAVAVVAATALATSGWYYLHLARGVHGTPAAFNRPLQHFALSNKPLEFYVGLGLPDVFRDPVRPAFDRQVLPKFYSELWGDHSWYFLVYKGIRMPDGRVVPLTNRPTMGPYLGRVNVVSLLPSAVLLAGIALGGGRLWRLLRRRDRAEAATVTLALAHLLVAVSVAAYGVFLVVVPEKDGDTIKASYLVQLAPLVALLAAEPLRRLRDRSPRGFAFLVGALVLVGLHNSGAYVTRYTPF